MRKVPHEEKSLTWKIHFSERRITITSGDDTFYIHPSRAQGYIHGDIVRFVKSRIAKDGKMAEAKPIRLVKRSEDEVLIEATITKKWVKWLLLPIFGSLNIEVTSNPKIEWGDIYIGKFESARKVWIIKLFGNKKDPNIQEELIFFRNNIRTKWPKTIENIEIEKPLIEETDETIKEFWVENLAQSMSLKENLFPKIQINKQERLDFRGWYTMTIDWSDAKDLDDAISIAKYEWGDTLLGVHIADVAQYVKEWSPLDKEGYERGTSIYTPGRVIPMLPEILSNHLCSLHPGEPKLVLSILLRIDRKWYVKESFVTEWIIESRHRGVYEEIGEILGWKDEKNTELRFWKYWTQFFNNISEWWIGVPEKILQNFKSLYHLLRERRKNEGKIIFDTTECYFDMDEKKNVLSIRKRERGEAHMMIEEFMVLANEEVAKWAIKRNIPFLSRVHDAPSVDKIREIVDIILANKEWLNEKILVSEDTPIEPHHIRSLLENAQSNEELSYRLSRLLLPKMAKAVYKEKPVRHFWLALTHYAHFTSPIRRYPDLLLHRMIKYHLSKVSKFDKKAYDKQMKKWWESLSEKERVAENVSRTIYDVFMCRYMSNHVEDVYEGTISWVTESNVYVELASGVEWSIYLSEKRSPKFYPDLARGSLRDKSGREIYQIWKKIIVKILSVDIELRRIEMERIDK